MSNLFDDSASLSQFKPVKAIANPQKGIVSAYLMERRLLRIIANEASSWSQLKQLSLNLNISMTVISDLVDNVVFKLEITELEHVLAAYDAGGVAFCLKSLLHNSSSELPEMGLDFSSEVPPVVPTITPKLQPDELTGKLVGANPTLLQTSISDFGGAYPLTPSHSEHGATIIPQFDNPLNSANND